MKVAVPALALLSLALAACGQTATQSSNLVTVNISMPSSVTQGWVTTQAVPTLANGLTSVVAAKILVYDKNGPVKFDANNAVSSTGSDHLTITPGNPFIIAKFHPNVEYTFTTSAYDTADFTLTNRNLVAFDSSPATFTDSINSKIIALKSVMGTANLATYLPVNYVMAGQTLDFVLAVHAPGLPTSLLPSHDFNVTYGYTNATGSVESPHGVKATATGGDLTVTATIMGLIKLDTDTATPGKLTAVATVPYVVQGMAVSDMTPPVLVPMSTVVTRQDATTVHLAGRLLDTMGLGAVNFWKGATLIATLDASNFVGADFSVNLTNLSASDHITMIAADTTGNELTQEIPNALATTINKADVYVDSSTTVNGIGTYAAPFNTLQLGYNSVDAGGTIHLAAGTYDGLTVTKQVNIVGPNQGLTGVTAYRAPEAVITGVVVLSTGSSNTLIDGIKIAQDSWPVAIENRLQIVYGSNVTIKNNVFAGPGPDQGTWNVSGVVRGMEISGGLTNIFITDNLFKGLRQPAYINSSYVTITGNHVDGSRGWVLADTKPVQIANNVFTNSEQADFALIMDNACPSSEFRTISAGALSAANNTAIVSDQRSSDCKK